MPLTQLILVVAYVLCPFILLRTRRGWSVPAAFLSLWIPVESGLFRWAGMNPTVTICLAMLAGLLAFHSRRDVLDLTSAFNVHKFQPRRALENFLIFAVVAIPAGVAIGFIRPVFNVRELKTAPALFAMVFMFNALPEEILFRGMIQNWLEKVMGGRIIALIAASLIFGAAHLNNGPPLPNYKYFALASIAGMFYGRAWSVSRNVLTSSLTHTLVNVSWRLFFR
jgi:membrane protease YdiL (CAAX protease family)